MSERCAVLTTNLAWLGAMILLGLLTTLLVFGFSVLKENAGSATYAVLATYNIIFLCIVALGAAVMFIATFLCIGYTYDAIYDEAVEQVKGKLAHIPMDGVVEEEPN